MIECSGFVYDDREWNPKRPDLFLCRCPICKGFLPSNLPDKPFKCRKCGSELITLPMSEHDDEPWDGKICPLIVGGKV